MGLLDKLWDDVLAGPQPDKGLKKLRKERIAAGLSDVFQDENDDFAHRMIDPGEVRNITIPKLIRVA